MPIPFSFNFKFLPITLFSIPYTLYPIPYTQFPIPHPLPSINHQVVHQFSHLELIAKQVVEGFITGLHKSPLHGFSVEFAEHQQYNKGESTRFIDWKLFARTDKLFVKRFEEETNLRCQIVIDNSSSMNFPDSSVAGKRENGYDSNKISFSAYCAAAIIYLLKMQRDAVGLSIFSEGIETHTPCRSSSVHQKRLFSVLDSVLLNEKKEIKTFAIDALHQIADNIHKRSLVLIFSDMMDNSPKQANEIFAALNHLKYNKHEVVLFHVTDKKREMDFEFENRPYTFIDLETGEKVKAFPKSVRESYLKAVRTYEKELLLRCAQYHIDFIKADINAGFNEILKSYLIKRERMF